MDYKTKQYKNTSATFAPVLSESNQFRNPRAGFSGKAAPCGCALADYSPAISIEPAFVRLLSAGK